MQITDIYPEELQKKIADGYQLALKMVPMPSDLNPAGDVFGGWVLSNVDVAGAIPAVKRSRGRVATVAFNSFKFNHPIQVGDLVCFFTKIIKEGITSMTIEVLVTAQRRFNFKSMKFDTSEILESTLVTDAIVTYVCMDENGQKRALPPLSSTETL